MPFWERGGRPPRDKRADKEGDFGKRSVFSANRTMGEREVIEIIPNQRVSAKSVSGPFTFSDGYAVVAMNESN